MDESTLGMVVFVGITVATATICHVKIKNYWVATILATLVSVILFQIVAYIELGYLDPFFLIAIVTSSAAALIISILVGALVKNYRGKIGSA
jgi:hypothetical protein